jgi:putative flippase GtrA
MGTSVRDLGSAQIGLRVSTSEQQRPSAFHAFGNATYQVAVGQAIDSAQPHGWFARISENDVTLPAQSPPALVGSLGLILHLATLGLLFFSMYREFAFSQTLATILAMTFNFLLNNLVTFRDRRVRGWHLVTGLLTFYAACSVGALTNISFAQFMLNSGAPWYLAGISGMAISSVWNYGVNTVFTWRRGQSHV